MLRELRVINYAIIDSLTLEFGPGLNILTGETGAGKSIVIGALGIALGERAYTDMIKTGKTEASVQALFDTLAHPVIETMGIAPNEEIIIRRNISSSGKGKAYINDSIVTVQSLAELGRSLVDIHGQHEHQSLLTPENQMNLLDKFGRLEGECEAVSSLHHDAQALRRRLDGLRTGERERAQRMDLLRFQIREIESTSLSPGEDTALEEERRILSNLSRLNELSESSYALLYSGEGSTSETLTSAASTVKEVASIDQEAEEALRIIEEALPLIEEASLSLRNLKDKYQMDPARLEEVENRIELITNLKRKYGETVEAILAYRDEALAELSDIENADETAEELEEKLRRKETLLHQAAESLSLKRRESAKRVEGAVNGVLTGLALEKSEFRIAITSVPPSLQGMDAVEFLFTAHRGEALRPLHRVASGGELSRVMLAIKSVLRAADRIPVLIFDEVDAGIGGRTAQNVADKLREISSAHQVLCITHLPQIASMADHHFVIEKKETSGRIRVTVRELTGEKRQEEIARMLGGDVTETSLEHARELIERKA
jgi:DNA repair protein RecN (Recombination protein N)